MQRDVDISMLRVPPQAIEAEASVLGTLLLDSRRWDQVGDLLAVDDFYRFEHRLIYGAMQALVLACKAADVITVYDALGDKAGEAGGLSYLNELVQFEHSPRNLRRHAELVREKAILRGLVTAADQVAQIAYAPGDDSVAERVDRAQQAVTSIQIGTGRSKPTHVSQSIVEMLDRIQNRADGTAPRGITTGIFELDRLLGGGFKGGKQVIVAARPSIGKSSLAQQLCINVAQSGRSAAFLSQEMSKEELVDRAAANLGHIDLERVISGEMEEGDWSRLTEAVERMRTLPLYLDEQPALTLHDISAKARMLKREAGLEVLVVDYIQLCAAGTQDKDTRHHQIESLSRGLKTLAKQLDITIITLSQLNREVEKRASGRPILSDLKESGAIEEDADVVMLLSRDGDENDGFRTIHCDIPKNRQGKTGALTLGFDGKYQQWRAVAGTTLRVPKMPPRKHYTEDV